MQHDKKNGLSGDEELTDRPEYGAYEAMSMPPADGEGEAVDRADVAGARDDESRDPAEGAARQDDRDAPSPAHQDDTTDDTRAASFHDSSREARDRTEAEARAAGEEPALDAFDRKQVPHATAEEADAETPRAMGSDDNPELNEARRNDPRIRTQDGPVMS